MIAGVNLAWAAAVRKLTPISQENRWNRVTGYVESIVCILLTIGVEPKGPLEWSTPTADWFVRPDQFPERTLKMVFSRIIALYLWGTASTFFMGKGAERGVDYSVMQRQIRVLERKGRVQEAGMLYRIAQAGVWTQSRRFDAQLAVTNLCRRCGLAADTERHRYWECPHNGTISDISHRALEEFDDCPLLWGRGLMPLLQYLTGPLDGQYSVQPAALVWGAFATQPTFVLPEGAFAGTDGSGGAYASDPRLRHVGFGVALLASTGHILDLARGAVEGQQSVPGAELSALVWLLCHTVGDLVVYVDAEHVVKGPKGWREGRLSPQHAHRDLWHQIRQCHGARQGVVEVRKTKGHATAQHLLAGHTSHDELMANHFADAQAELAASDCALPQHVVDRVFASDVLARSVIARLLAINMVIVTDSDFAAVEKVERPPKCVHEPPNVLMFQRAFSAGHVLMALGKRVTCCKCLRGSRVNGGLAWLSEPFHDLTASCHLSHFVLLKRFTVSCLAVGAELGGPLAEGLLSCCIYAGLRATLASWF